MDLTRLKNYLDYAVENNGLPGVDCMICKEHKPIFRYYTGMSDAEAKKYMQGNELYFIYSMTKMMTCTAALQLFEQGKYLMSDPVSKFLPEFEKMKITSDSLDVESAKAVASGKTAGESVNASSDGYAKNPITIKDLFTMGAGLDYDLDAPGIKAAKEEGRGSTRELVAALSETVLGFEPGTRFRYSLCHDVLGALIEVISGKTFGEYMKENLFDPLGLKDTFFGKPKDEGRLSRMAALYKLNDEGRPERQPLENPFCITEDYESGGAGLVSCTEDYENFLDAIANGGEAANGNRILMPKTVDLMRQNHLSKQQLEDFYVLREGYGYGLGVRTHIDREKSGRRSPIGEFGWDGAAGAFCMVDPVNKISLTYFQHVLNSGYEVHKKLRDLLYSCLEG